MGEHAGRQAATTRHPSLFTNPADQADPFPNSDRVTFQIIIAKANYRDALIAQILITRLVILMPVLMTLAIQFNGNSLFHVKEVEKVRSKGVLSAEFEARHLLVSYQLPKDDLGTGHI